MALCRTCGSQGIHMACGQLKWANPVWECNECTSILRKYLVKERYYNYEICNLIYIYFFCKGNSQHNNQTARLNNSSAIDRYASCLLFNLTNCGKFLNIFFLQ